MVASKQSRTSNRIAGATGRRGVATVWMILATPAVLTMLVVVVEIGSLWLAQIELTNALEAAALVGAQDWARLTAEIPPESLGDISSGVRDGVLTLAAANTVNGKSVVLNDNYGGSAPNYNLSASGNVVLGAVTVTGNQLMFDPNLVPTPTELFGCHVQATVSVTSIFSKLFGINSMSYSVTRSATATAIIGSANNNPQLRSANSFPGGTFQ
jgi:Flp pilus assembly protein TadG